MQLPVIRTPRCKFVSPVKVNVDKYFNINGVIQLVRSLVSGTTFPESDSIKTSFIFATWDENCLDFLYALNGHTLIESLALH